MVFNKTTDNQTLMLENEKLTQVEYYKYLGVGIGEELNFHNFFSIAN